MILMVGIVAKLIGGSEPHHQNVGAISFVFIRTRRAPMYEIVISLLGIAFLA